MPGCSRSRSPGGRAPAASRRRRALSGTRPWTPWRGWAGARAGTPGRGRRTDRRGRVRVPVDCGTARRGDPPGAHPRGSGGDGPARAGPGVGYPVARGDGGAHRGLPPTAARPATRRGGRGRAGGGGRRPPTRTVDRSAQRRRRVRPRAGARGGPAGARGGARPGHRRGPRPDRDPRARGRRRPGRLGRPGVGPSVRRGRLAPRSAAMWERVADRAARTFRTDSGDPTGRERYGSGEGFERGRIGGGGRTRGGRPTRRTESGGPSAGGPGAGELAVGGPSSVTALSSTSQPIGALPIDVLVSASHHDPDGEPLPPAIVHRVVRRFLLEAGCPRGSLTAGHIRAVAALLDPPVPCDAPRWPSPAVDVPAGRPAPLL